MIDLSKDFKQTTKGIKSILLLDIKIYNNIIIKTSMLGITMQLDISARLTPQVTTIICHYMKKNIVKKNTKKYGKTRPKLIC